MLFFSDTRYYLSNEIDEQWEEILSAVNNEGGNLNENNVIEKIKKRLKVKDKDEYDKWEKADFDVNHRFEWEGTKHNCTNVVI